MKRCRFSKIAFVLFLFLLIPGISCKEPVKTSTKQKSEAPQPAIEKKETQAPTFQGRAVSLKVLQNRLKACQEKGSCPDELLQLAGLKRIVGYVVDVPNHDIILLGQVDDTLPSLYLENFVIAVRNAWLKYATRKGNTIYYSNPGCSIDPSPRVREQLDVTKRDIFRSSSVDQIEKRIQRWHEVCRSPQQVRVLGIPFNTRFAWVMVKADYDMKNLVDGSDSLNIPGFISLTDMSLEIAKSDIIQGKPVSIPLSSMNRFWFYPGKNGYREDERVVTIDQCPVVLLSEEEYLTKKGGITGTGRPDPLANRFCEIFTSKYAEVAKQRPLYIELENLFRFVALAKIINFKSAHNEAGLDMTYLLEHFPVPQTSVSQHLPGRSNVKDFRHEQDIPGGRRTAMLWLPSCGGVGINISVSQSNFVKDTTGSLLAVKATVLKARPSPEALSWDFPLRWRVRLEQGEIPFTRFAKR